MPCVSPTVLRATSVAVFMWFCGWQLRERAACNKWCTAERSIVVELKSSLVPPKSRVKAFRQEPQSDASRPQISSITTHRRIDVTCRTDSWVYSRTKCWWWGQRKTPLHKSGSSGRSRTRVRPMALEAVADDAEHKASASEISGAELANVGFQHLTRPVEARIRETKTPRRRDREWFFSKLSNLEPMPMG